MATHGHIYDLNAYDTPEVKKEKYSQMATRAKNEGAQVVFFGHNHQAEEFYFDDLLFFNPGEITYSSYKCTYGIVEIHNGVISTEIVEIDPLPLK